MCSKVEGGGRFSSAALSGTMCLTEAGDIISSQNCQMASCSNWARMKRLKVGKL